MKINNASSIPLNANTGTVPDVSGALQNWFQPMVFTTIVKTIVDFQNVETPTDIQFMGVWQPFSSRKLSMKPEGQRAWKWFTVHSGIALGLKPDEVITYLGTQYRVMADSDYSLYGYFEYEIKEDYEGSGPG